MQQAINYLTKKDKIFKHIVHLYGLPALPTRQPGFETLVLFILEQKVSLYSAKATFLQLKTKLLIFDPEHLHALPEEEYRISGVSRQKTTYIKALATAILQKNIDLQGLAAKPAAQVREELIKIKGIGNWTIDVYLMFCLRAPDILPLGDIAVIITIKELLLLTDKQAIETYTIKWSPYRSVATFLLWHYYLQKRNRKMAW